jgi:broad specificity phosphatase PhoE
MTPLAPPRSFLCLRHGATDWNRQGRFQGLTDNPLNEDGVAHARAAAERLRHVPFDHVVSSPLVRAVATAEIIAASRGKSVAIDSGIIECDFGSLEGERIAEVMKTHDLKTVEDLVSILPPDGEAWPAIAPRALRCVGNWLGRHERATILFVCHDAVMQAMSDALCGRWLKNRHGTPFHYERSGERWSVEEIG